MHSVGRDFEEVLELLKSFVDKFGTSILPIEYITSEGVELEKIAQ